MAYQRPKLTSQAQLAMSPSDLSVVESQSVDRDDKLKSERYVKPLLIFTLDITHWSHTIQSVILIGGLILFMCLYGYYQELVIYGWFNRQLSLFSTFLHFLGCSIFAQISRNYSYKPPSNGHAYGMSMGTAPPYVALGYYMLLVITKTAAQGMSNLCMTQINYPAKVLFKSANPVITMLIGR
ncbi:hypothetical protein EON63_05565 [archaeon]|nr:MAG: hypothetical protein EON63_05565 [archaeon]